MKLNSKYLDYVDYFSSLQEYEGYMACLNRAGLGDEVLIYCRTDDYGRKRTSTEISNTTARCTVIAIDCVNPYTPAHRILLGLKERIGCFWELPPDYELAGKRVADFASYPFALFPLPQDVKIAQIIRKR